MQRIQIMKILVFDNYDSFTYNLVHLVKKISDATVDVFRNDEIALEKVRDYDKIILSPGPGIPEEAGLLLPLIKEYAASKSMLGVCLGHQAIALHAGGRVNSADSPVHGKASELQHDGRGPFANLPSPMRVARYHSLAARDLPERFTIHAAIGDMAMAFSDPVAKQIGLQFHPESILTTYGDRLLANILATA